MCIDLHTHSIHSDGICTPAELVAMAVEHGLRGLSLTDHDTVDGAEEMDRLCAEAGLAVISGVEISTSLHGHTLHILGYGIDPANAELLHWLVPLQQGRERRNAVILQKLQNLGVDITPEEVEELSHCGQTGRPHIARLLVAKGVVDSFDAAFRQYLGRNKPAWEGRFSYPAAETIAMIHRAGGLAVLAHPGQIDPSMSIQPALIRELTASGLDGLELYYPTHSQKMKKQLKALAAQCGLLLTGGSDFHGATRPMHHLAGKASGFCPPCSLLEQLTARLAERRQ
ncbi:MAG: PHP domain-containing protein [Proteobacteria bacterium]|nr:PHP domain-containing protein [Pseudomonadota bacterium]